MTVSRRGFIGGVAALFAAPAIVRASSLMPVRAPKLTITLEQYAERYVAPVTERYAGLLTPEIITRESLQILRKHLVLANCIDVDAPSLVLASHLR